MADMSDKTKQILSYAAALGTGVVIGVVAVKYVFKYKPPAVWRYIPQGGRFGSMNRPTAGARETKILPKGEHNLQLYSLATPNGQKVTCLLEALNLKYGVEYDAFTIKIMDCEQFGSGFVEANPNSKIPALLHYEAKEEKPTRVFESASIMMYLCEKYDNDNVFLPAVGDKRRAECLSWLFWVQGSAPYLGGGFGHFYNYAPIKIQYAIDRFTMEAKRQLDVLEKHFTATKSAFLCGETPTIADFCCFPWYGNLVDGKLYNSAEFLDVKQYKNIIEWSKKMGGLDSVKRGVVVNRTWGTGEKLEERHSSNDFVKIGL